jgi:hypothetical protein
LISISTQTHKNIRDKPQDRKPKQKMDDRAPYPGLGRYRRNDQGQPKPQNPMPSRFSIPVVDSKDP